MIHMIWVRNQPTMKVIDTGRGDKFIRVSCLVRNELNGWRPNPKKLPKTELVHAISAANHETHEVVMPRPFPSGLWDVAWIEARTNPYQRPFVIMTDAWQFLDVWSVGPDGGYDKPRGYQVADHMYGLHYSTSNTTLGCIKIHNMDDLDDLVERIDDTIKNGETCKLEVVDG